MYVPNSSFIAEIISPKGTISLRSASITNGNRLSVPEDAFVSLEVLSSELRISAFS